MPVVCFERDDPCFDGRGVFELARCRVEIGGPESSGELEDVAFGYADAGEEDRHGALLSFGVSTGSAVKCSEPTPAVGA